MLYQKYKQIHWMENILDPHSTVMIFKMTTETLNDTVLHYC